MHDERFDKLAKLLVEYSIRLKRNETVLIEAFDIPDEMTAALIRAARNAGGVPFAQLSHARVKRATSGCTRLQLNDEAAMPASKTTAGVPEPSHR